MTEWIDIHAHLDMLEDTPENSVALAAQHSVNRIITIGTEAKDHPVVLEIAQKLYPKVFCTLGIHPHHGDEWTSATGDFICQNLHHPWVVAVGEIGLDYYYKNSSVEAQKSSFATQLDLAVQNQMPVEIHTRDAEQDTIDILQNYKGKLKGVIHCFTGSLNLAQKCLDYGFDISFSGVVTFKNAHDLRATCQYVPFDRMHVETDAPFLAPVPQRGKKNTPAFVTHTAEFVAQLRGVPLAQLSTQTLANARQLFAKII